MCNSWQLRRDSDFKSCESMHALGQIRRRSTETKLVGIAVVLIDGTRIHGNKHATGITAQSNSDEVKTTQRHTDGVKVYKKQLASV